MSVREKERVDANGGNKGPLPIHPNGGNGGVETRALSVASGGGGADGGDGGDEGESVAGEEEESPDAKE